MKDYEIANLKLLSEVTLGLNLSESETKTLLYLAKDEPSTVINIVNIIATAKKYELHERGDVIW